MKEIEELIDLVEKIGIDKLEQEGKLNNKNSAIFEEIKNSKIENGIKADITTFETQSEAVVVIVKKSSEESIGNTEDFKQELINRLSLNNDVEINQTKISVSQEELGLLTGEVGTNNISLSSIVTNVGGMREFKLNNNFTGMNGSGYSIVILDTGIDLDHSFFGPDANGDGIADRIIYTQDFSGEGDGTVNDVNGHGTHVASIAASSDGTYGGVASGANIIVLQVLSNSGSGGYGGIESALQWIIANSERYNIASVNMSLGSGENYKIDTPAYNLSDELATLKSQNVMTVVAAGNSYGSYQSVGVSSPASDASVISVGATYDAGDIAYFSQRGDLVEIFAPGYNITAARAGGGVVSYSGTSMATPFITGLVATAQQIAVRDLGRKLTQDEFVALLQISGDNFIDSTSSGTTYQNVNVNNLAVAIGQINNLLLMGASSNDTLTTTNETIQKLYGFAGNDTLIGNGINNILEGGNGNDTLMGGNGNDTYIFKSGEGQDLIIDDLGANLIKLGVFNLSQISASYVGDDLVMRFSGSTDSITYKDFKINSNKNTIDVEFYNLDNNTTLVRRLNSFVSDNTNTAPISVNDAQTLNEDDRSVVINVLGNDTDAENHRLSIDSFTQPTRGTLVKNANGTFTYTPNANYFGTDSFTYIAIDELGLRSQSATVTLTINSINDAPIVTTAIDNYIIGINEVKRGNVGAIDVDGDVLSYSVTTMATNGTLSVDANGNWSYTANNNYLGNDSAVITISDGKNGSVTKTLNFLINNEIANNINTTATINVGGTFENVIEVARDEDWVKVSLVSGKTYDINLTGITLSDTYLKGIYNKDGVFISNTQNDDSNGTYNSYVKFTATYSGDYYISAGAFGNYTGTYRLEVKENASNTSPIANNDNVNLNEDTSIKIDVLANDTDAQNHKLSIDTYTLPTRGRLIKNIDGTFTYTPNENYYGTDSFTYTVVDELGLKSQSATVTLTISNVNDKPVLSAISQIDTTKDASIINGIFSATDVDSTALTYSTTLSVDGFTLNRDGTYSFNPSHESYQYLKNGEIRTITIPVSVSDGELVDTKDLVIKITGTNNAPVAVADIAEKVVQGEFLVNTYTDHAQGSSSVVGLKDGGYVITWESYGQDGSNYGIYAQRYNSVGEKIGEETQINTYTNGYQWNSVITALNDGGYVIVWESTNGQDGSLGGIYSQRYGANGIKMGEETLVNTYTNSYQDQPSIAGLNDGGYVITWQSSYQDGGAGGIYAQRYNANGSKFGEESLVNTNTVNSQRNPSIIGLNDGGYVITWSSYGQDGSDDGIYAQRYNSFGVKVGDETQINTYTNSFQDSPSITALNDGGYVITWRSAYQDGSIYGIYAQRYNSFGIKVGDEIQINSYTNLEQETPSIEALSDGGYIIAWNSYAQDGSGYGVYAQRYNAFGIKVGDETLINTYKEDYQGSPSIALLSDGGYVISWTSFNQDGSSDGIYAQRFDKDGNKYKVDGRDLTTSENAPFIIDVLANDYDLDGNTISIKSVDDVMIGGKKVGETSIVLENGIEKIKFTPIALDYLKDGEEITVSFNYTIADIHGATSIGNVTVKVTGTNDAPILSPISQINTTEDATIINGILNAVDVDRTTLTYSTTVIVNGFTLNANGTYSFNPAHSAYQSLKAGEEKIITIPVSVSDGSLSDTKDLVIKITGTNDKPTVVTAVDYYTLKNNIIQTGVIGASDIDKDTLNYIVSTTPKNGIITVNTNGNWSYTAKNNYVGNDSAVITVIDGKGGSVTKTLNFTIQGNEIANNITTTATINVGGIFESAIDFSSDQDWVKVSFVAGKTYDVNLTGITLGDTYLRGIYNTNGILISNTQNDDSNGTLNSYVKFTATYSGNYYLSAGAYSSYTGTYRLEAQESNSSVITGNSSSNVLVGTTTNDTIQALAGNDTIKGGKGNDRLYGGIGNDTYNFVSGDGQDNIYDSTGADNIVFDNTVSKAGVSLYLNGKDLSFQYTNQDNINVSLWSNASNKIEKFQLADGNYLTSTDIDTLIQSMTAYATNNGISLSNADDVRKNNELMTMIANTWHK